MRDLCPLSLFSSRVCGLAHLLPLTLAVKDELRVLRECLLALGKLKLCVLLLLLCSTLLLFMFFFGRLQRARPRLLPHYWRQILCDGTLIVPLFVAHARI